MEIILLLLLGGFGLIIALVVGIRVLAAIIAFLFSLIGLK